MCLKNYLIGKQIILLKIQYELIDKRGHVLKYNQISYRHYKPNDKQHSFKLN
jgi:hypothetical protein